MQIPFSSLSSTPRWLIFTLLFAVFCFPVSFFVYGKLSEFSPHSFSLPTFLAQSGLEGNVRQIEAMGGRVKVDPEDANHIVAIDLGGTDLVDSDLPLLARIHSLKFLNLAGTRITDNGVASLAHLTHLETLILHSTTITGSGLTNYRSQLITIDLDLTKADDQGLTFLDNMPTLTSFDFFGTQVTDKGLQHLGPIPEPCLAPNNTGVN